MTRTTFSIETRKPYSVVGSDRATAVTVSAAPTRLRTPPTTATAVSWDTTARCRRGDAKNVGTTVWCPYSRATAIAPNSPAPMKALAANAMSDCWSASVAMNALLPSMSVPAITASALTAAMTARTPRNAKGILVLVSLRSSERMSGVTVMVG
jgi:hypothetical protein